MNSASRPAPSDSESSSTEQHTGRTSPGAGPDSVNQGSRPAPIVMVHHTNKLVLLAPGSREPKLQALSVTLAVVAAIELPEEKQHKEGRVYSSSGLPEERLWGEDTAMRRDGITSSSTHKKPKREHGVGQGYQTSQPAPSDGLPPAKSHAPTGPITFPHTTTNCRPSF